MEVRKFTFKVLSACMHSKESWPVLMTVVTFRFHVWFPGIKSGINGNPNEVLKFTLTLWKTVKTFHVFFLNNPNN